VAELGSVFEAEDGSPRGPDLRVTVEVPRAALGATLRAPVPQRIAADGDLVERAVVGDDDPETIELHLPDSLPEGAVLRLRGQGGVGPREGGRAGDLMVVVELVDRPPRPDETIVTRALAQHDDREVATVDPARLILIALVLAGAGVVLVFLLA
jgi:hypothetical protein